MSIVGFKAKNHPHQVGPRGVSRKDLLPGLGEIFAAAPDEITDDVDDRAVTEAMFAVWQERWNFTVDAAANHHNAKCARYWTKESNGLAQSWANERVYCNPPYSDIRPWVEKAWAEVLAPVIVMLLPANRTEQEWWQDLVEPKRDRPGSPLRSIFLPGRIKFLAPGEDQIRKNNRPPFGCLLLEWQR